MTISNTEITSKPCAIVLQYTFSINDLVLETFEILSNENSDHELGLPQLKSNGKFLLPRVCGFDLVAKINLKIYKSFDC